MTAVFKIFGYEVLSNLCNHTNVCVCVGVCVFDNLLVNTISQLITS